MGELSTSELKDFAGNVALDRGERLSLAGDGYVEVLNGGGREPLGLAGRSLRRLERYSTRKRGVSLVLSDATTGPFVVVRQVLTFLLVRHEGWLRRRDLPFEFSKTCHFMQHFEGNVRINGRLDQKNGFITG